MQVMPMRAHVGASPTPTVAPNAPGGPVPAAPTRAGVDVAAAPGSPDPIVPDDRPGRQAAARLGAAVKGVMDADADARVTVDRSSNVATFLSGEFGVVVRPGVGGSGPDKLARTFLSQHGRLFGVDDPLAQLRLVDIDKDALGFRHFRYEQVQGGLPVFGQQLVVHAQGDRVTSVGGRITPNIEASTSPRLGRADAADRALRALPSSPETPGVAARPRVGAQELGWYTLEDGEPRLAYEVIVGSRDDQRWQMYVDATSGELLDKWSLVHGALDRETVDAQRGKVRTERDGPTGDAVLDAAHDNAGKVHAYFAERHGRDSIDGKGMRLKSVVHYGTKYNNAFWNGSHMTYGDGDGTRFLPFALATDVVTHEMTHGITERTAGLRYQRQSGALNESWSDVFGNLVEKWVDAKAGMSERDPKWLVGEEIFTPGVDGDGLRSMSRPGSGYDKDPQPGHMRDYKNTGSDNGGVHINSGIPNKAAYEVAMAIGVEKLGDVWYRALTSYLTPTSQFTDAANVTVQSAIDLYGAGSAEAKAVAAAWAGVGLAPSVAPGVSAA